MSDEELVYTQEEYDEGCNDAREDGYADGRRDGQDDVTDNFWDHFGTEDVDTFNDDYSNNSPEEWINDSVIPCISNLSRRERLHLCERIVEKMRELG